MRNAKMLIPMDDVPDYEAEEMEVAQDPELRALLEKFIKSNYKNFSISDMSHVLGISPKVIHEIIPWLTNKERVQHRTQMVVVVKLPEEAQRDSERFNNDEL